ncbi:MAG: hypothetical protein LCH91_21620 [Bacteroidetes bacterium]|nr:hypothetical protein [Bacteroidota bacterium]
MNLKTLFTVNAIVNFLFSIPMLIVPQFICEIYSSGDVLLNEGTYSIIRHYGGLIFGLGIAFSLLRNVPYSNAIKSLMIGAIVANVLLAITHAISILKGIDNAQAWGIVAIGVVLPIWMILVIQKNETTKA